MPAELTSDRSVKPGRQSAVKQELRSARTGIPVLQGGEKSKVFPLSHPDEGGPAPDGRQVGGEQALDEDRRGGVGLGAPGRGEAQDYAGWPRALAAGRGREAAD